MKIHSFRVGFATNSSSSHSIILIPQDAVGRVSDVETSYGENEFGWDFFRLASPEQKLRYLAAQLITRLDIDHPLVRRVGEHIPGYNEWLDEMIAKHDSDEEERRWFAGRPSVDHQSVLNFSSFPEKHLDDLIGFFQSDRVVVLGGNDNSDYDWNDSAVAVEGAEKIEFFDAIRDYSGRSAKFRKDGEHFIVFDPQDGTKARLSLTGDAEYVKASVPELVDLKITNYCTKGCKFCYQASTPEGVHASFDDIERILVRLSEMGVFEIAIGGGEPTEHPEFARILHRAFELGITPNFTTLSGKWLDNEDIVKTVEETVGGIGVSCTDVKALALYEEIKDRLTRQNGFRDRPRVTAQHVVGAVPIDTTAAFLNEAFRQRVPILLLGYKEVGFGSQYRRHDRPNDDVILKLCIDNATAQRYWPTLSVDTALLDQYPNFIKSLGVPDALATSPEGKFSCYIDAVTGSMGPSSYVEPSTMVELPDSIADFKTIFAEF